MTSTAADDLRWLAGHCVLAPLCLDIPVDTLRDHLTDAARAGVPQAVVHPTHLDLVPDGICPGAVVGYPTGRHHSLVKAAEARLAIHCGAEEIWLTVDPWQPGNAQLADVVAVRQSIPDPVELYLVAGGAATSDSLAELTRLAGLVGAAGVVADGPGAHTRRVDDLAGAVDALASGAQRVACATVMA